MPASTPTTDSPLISVLVTSYNHAPFIRQCIDSLLNQTYRRFRITVVDDCSTDGTAEILRSYGDRIDLTVRPRNRGVEAHAETINEAIRRADGYFFYRIDSDDFIAPDYFEQMIAAWRRDRTL
ncbi:MAG: glycosyltransferase family 2 protein, partial [Candidatus Zixiibacteriota bacterium]